MQVAEFAKLAESLETLLRERKGDDAMRCPLVGSDILGFGVLAEERKLVEVVCLESVRARTD